MINVTYDDNYRSVMIQTERGFTELHRNGSGNYWEEWQAKQFAHLLDAKYRVIPLRYNPTRPVRTRGGRPGRAR